MSSSAAQGRGDTLIRGATLINEGRRSEQDVLIRGERIEQIGGSPRAQGAVTEIEAGGKWLLPGLIDDQVHFREPGHVHKGNIASESAAAVAGGVTSFMDMPNVSPATVTRERLAAKYAAAKGRAHGNYAFYLGATENNLEEIQALKGSEACGVKVFMGPSTGDLLVEDPVALERIFASCPVLIATHCEDRSVIERNLAKAKREHGPEIPPRAHPEIRDAECCYRSSSMAVGLARKHGAKLHVLHLTTARELELFDPSEDLGARSGITAEVCVHHLWFDEADYAALGNRIKCNPAIKSKTDRMRVTNGIARRSNQRDRHRPCATYPRREIRALFRRSRRAAAGAAFPADAAGPGARRPLFDGTGGGSGLSRSGEALRYCGPGIPARRLFRRLRSGRSRRRPGRFP